MHARTHAHTIIARLIVQYKNKMRDKNQLNFVEEQ